MTGIIHMQVSVNIGNEIVESLGPAEVKQRASLKQKTKQNSCSKCAMISYCRMQGSHGFLHRPYIHSVLTNAAICVCVCFFFKSMHGNLVTPFVWDNVNFFWLCSVLKVRTSVVIFCRKEL